MPFDDFLRDEKDQATQPPSGALTPPKTDHGFGDFLQGLQATTTQTAQAGAVADAHGPVSADQAAQAAPLGRQLGLPQGVVETDLAAHQAQAKAQSNAALLASNPVLASWAAANPDAARVAQDEYAKLSAIEKGWGAVAKVGYAGIQALGSSFNQSALALNRQLNPIAQAIGAGPWWQRQFLSPLEGDQAALTLPQDAGIGEKAAAMAGNLLGLLSQITLTGGGGGSALPASAGAVETLGHAAQTAARSMAFPSLVASTNAAHDVYQRTLDPSLAAKAAVAHYLFTTAQGMVPFSAPGALPTRLFTGALSGAATSEGQRAAMNLLMPPEMQQGFSADEMIFQALSGAVLGGVMGARADPHLHDAVRQTYVEAARAEQAERDVGKVAALGQIAAESKLREADPDAFHAFVKTVTDQSELDAVYVDGKSLAAAYAQSGVRPPQSVAEQLSEASNTSGYVRIPVADYATHIAGTDLEKTILPLMKAAPDGMTMAEGQTYFQKAAETLTQRAQEIANKKQQADVLAEDTDAVHKSLGEELGRANRFPKAVNDLYASHLTNFFSTLAARKNIRPSEAMAAYPLHVTSALAHGAQTMNQGRVTFEVAPDPRDTALTFKWDALPPQTKTDVSASIGKAVSEGALASLKDSAGKPLKGQFEQHLGGWMDATNPSMSLVLDGKAEAYGPTLARVLGHALNQQGMMYSSPEPFHGGHEMGAIRVEVGHDATPEQVASLYAKLREIKDDKGEPLVFGHTTADGQMVILNDGSRINTEALGRLIDEHLGGAYTVESGTMYAEFPEKGNDDYGLSGQQHEAARSGAEPSLREAADQLRREAAARLAEAIGGHEAEAGRRAAEPSEPDAGVTQTPAFRDWFGASRVVDENGQPQVVYHGTAVDREGFERDSANGPGVYFSPRADVASEYAKMDGDAAHVVPVYLSLQNPKTLPLGESHNITAEQRDALEAQGYDGLIGVTKSGRVSEYVAFRPEQVKSALGNQGTFDANDRRILYQNGQVPAFFSALARGVDSLPMKAGDASAWSQALKGLESRGVKREEIAWTGLEDWLKLQDGKVSKEQVAEFLRGNGVQVHETVLADTSMHVERMNAALDGTGIKAIYDSADEAISYEDRSGAAIDYAELPEQVKEIIDRVAAQGNGTFDVKAPAKYGQYTLPGGTHYREVLLTLPDTRTPQAKAMQATEEAAGGQVGFPESGGDYRSPHWEQPNVLAHFRVDDRVDADGRKVLFVHELQSDWGQQGKKAGFKKPGDRGITDAEFEEYRTLGRRTELSGPEQDRYDELAALNQSKASNALPAAPFVGKTEAWVSLALKRIIKMAADEGYQRVAFVNGEQSAERYDLSKQIRKLRWDDATSGGAGDADMQKPEGRGMLYAYDHDGNLKIDRSVDHTELPDLIGKEAAEKLLKTEAKRARSSGGTGIRRRELSGLDLKVGGEGMKAFYDKIVPNVAKDVLKKIGGEGLRDVSISVPNENSNRYLGDREFNPHEAEIVKRGDVYQVWADGKLQGNGNFATREEAERFLTSGGRGDVLQQTGLDITPGMREKAAGGFPLFQGGDTQRAQISFGHDITKDPSVLSLLQHADLSSFLHESGHYFLEVYGDLAKKGEAFAQQDLGVLRKWWADNANHMLAVMDQDIGEATGAKKSQLEAERDAINAAGGAEFLKGHAATWSGGQDATSEARIATTLMHEYWARGYERYMMEGTAPSTEMRGMFSRFRAWLLGVYKSLDALNVHLTPEVRGVMDRMLATDAAIHQAETLRSYAPLFDNAKAAGMTSEAFNAYLAQGREATDAAVSELQARSLRDMKWASNAKSQALKDLQRQADAARRDVAAQVENEVSAYPAFQAQDYMRANAGKVDSEALKEWSERQEAVTERAREAAKAALFAANPEVKGLQKGQLLARNKRALDNAAEAEALKWQAANPKPKADAGADPEIVAGMFGFDSADAMRRAVAEAGDKRDIIQALTDQRMLQEHGELLDAQSIENAANEAVHNEARARFMATGLKALTASPLPASQIAAAAKLAAETTIAGKRVADLRPDQYLAAEARSNKEALAKAAKDPVAAIDAQRTALLNNRLAKAALDAKNEIDKGLEYLKRFDKPGVALKIGADYMDRINELLSGYDVTRRFVTQADVQARVDMRAWLQAEFDKTGIMPEVSDALLDFTTRRSWKELSVEEFRGLVDAAKSLEHVGREQTLITVNGQKMDLLLKVQQAQADLAGVAHNAPVDIQPHLLHASGLDKLSAKFLNAKSKIRGMDAALLKMEQLFQWLTYGNKAGLGETRSGPFLEMFQRVADAEGAERAMRADAVKDLKALADTLHGAKVDLHESLALPLKRPGRGGQWYREELLAAALNFGNEGNLRKLVAGYREADPGWSEQGLKAMLDQHLSAAEWKFVQGVWDAVGKYGPQIEALQKRLTGTAPKMVEPRSFQTPHGEMKGGYYPAVYDAFLDRTIEQKNMQNADQLFENQWARPATSQGHTVNRTDYTGPIYLSLGVINRHLDQVTHDLAWREAIIDVNKFLSHPAIVKEVDEVMGREYTRQFRPWLQAMANDRVFNTAGDSAWEGFVRKVRSNTTMVGLGFRLSTMLIHGGSALSNSIGEVGAKWFAKGAAQFASPERWEQAKQFMYERSPEMANRFNEIDRNVKEAIDEINRHQASLGPVSATQKAVDAGRRFAFYGVQALDMGSAAPTWMAAYLKGMSPEAKGGLGFGEDAAIDYANRAVRNAHGGGGTKDLSAVQRDKGVISLATMFYSYWNHCFNRQRDIVKGYANLGESFRQGTGAKDFAKLLARSWFYFAIPQLIHAYLKPSPPGQDEPEDLAGEMVHMGEEVALGFVSGVPVLRDLANAAVNGRDYTVTPIEAAGKSVVKAAVDTYKIAQGEEPSAHAGKNFAQAAGYVAGVPTGQLSATGSFLWDVYNGDADPQGVREWYQGIQNGRISDK